MQTSYALTATEQTTIQQFAGATIQAKLRVYELNMELEQAQKQRDASEAMYQGALILLAQSQGLPGATLSPDFTTLTGAKPNG